MSGANSQQRWGRFVLWAALLVTLAGGLALRLAFLSASHPHVDEYSTIWAALQVIEKGVPLLPSGFIYLQGVLFTYLDAAFIALFGFSEWAARLPSVLLSVLTIAVVYAGGRRSFGAWFGLMAATLTALAPEAIVWGGRARMYALQQALFVLAIYAFWRGYVREEQVSGWRWAFACLFVGALLSQTITVLALPALAISLILWRASWRQNRRALWPLVAVACGVLVALWLNHVGGPVSDTAERAFVAFSFPWQPKPAYFFREYFWSWPSSLRTWLFLAGFILILARRTLSIALTCRGKISDSSQPSGARTDARTDLMREGTNALLYLYAVVAGVLLPMFFLVGESWQRPRYLIMLQPVVDLLAVGVLWYLFAVFSNLATGFSSYIHSRHVNMDRPSSSMTPGTASWRRFALGIVMWVCIGAIFLPPAVRAIRPAEPAYDLAFRYVRERWAEGDSVVGPLPSIPAVYLGRCDGYMLQDGFEEYLVWQNGQPVDRWTGAPLIDSVEAFERRFGHKSRVWFAVDSTRWQQRYTPEFRQYIEQHMPLVYQAYEVAVYQYVPKADGRVSPEVLGKVMDTWQNRATD